MRNPCLLLLFFLLGNGFSVQAQTTSVAEKGQALKVLRQEIQQAFLAGDSSQIYPLFLQGLALRSFDAGKPLSDPYYSLPDTAGIHLSDVEKIWNLSIERWVIWQPDCPEVATETPASMLGLLYAKGKDLKTFPPTFFRDVANMLVSQQFTSSKASVLPGFQEGSFGYAYRKEGEEDCALTGPVQRLVLQTCAHHPEVCPEYKSGMFAGYRFMVSDQFPGVSEWDSPMSYHTAWAVEELIYSYIHLRDSLYLRSAHLAGDWMLAEKPVVNHSLTAKNIWGLAALYDASGDLRYRTRLLKLLNHCLLVGVLADKDSNRLVDGTDIPFDSLCLNARLPGRMWDAVNASSWGTALNALAVVNAYAALRDRGDRKEADKLYYYAETMLTNLCTEITDRGTPPAGSGFRDLAFTVLEALWKIDRAEKKRHLLWENAAAVLWNSGVLRSSSESAVVLGQYLRWLRGSPYQSRFQQMTE